MVFRRTFFLLFFTALFFFPITSQAKEERQPAVVLEVLTGDSVRLQGGKTLKYIGVQSPPLQSLMPLLRKYGESALEFNKNLVQKKKIFVEWDSQIKDNQNNLLGYVFLEDGTFANKEILRNGCGKFRILPPNLHYSAIFRRAELEARREKKGLWKEEPDNPFIKSEYIGEKNTKVYYFPTSSELERIPEANLVKFRSRVEAKAAGYRPCPTCHENQVDEY